MLVHAHYSFSGYTLGRELRTQGSRDVFCGALRGCEGDYEIRCQPNVEVKDERFHLERRRVPTHHPFCQTKTRSSHIPVSEGTRGKTNACHSWAIFCRAYAVIKTIHPGSQPFRMTPTSRDSGHSAGARRRHQPCGFTSDPGSRPRRASPGAPTIPAS